MSNVISTTARLDRSLSLSKPDLHHPQHPRFLLACRLLIVLALGALSLTSCGKRPGVVEGTVTDTGNGEAVAGAQVVVFELAKSEDVKYLDVYQKGVAIQKLRTDENGGFSTSLEADSYIIQVWIEGLEVADQMVQVKAGQTTTIDFQIDGP